MHFFDNLYRMVQIGTSVAVVCIVLYAVIGQIWFRKRPRVYGARLGNALQELQAIARPSIQHEIEEKFKERKEEDHQGGPDDPRIYYRRLREKIDRQARNGIGNGDDDEAKP